MNKRFIGKRVVVTGGCRGIGKAIAERFASEGARVYALDYVIPEEGIVSENDELQKMITALQCDVTNEESVKNAIDQVISESKNIDILINNAGITRDNLILRMSAEQWDAVINTNLKGTFIVTKSLIRNMMSQRKGRIINIGSIVGSIGNAGQCNYSSSKAGMIGFTKSIAKELGSRNITANLVAPGYVQTAMTDELTEEQQNKYLENIPLRRAATADDISNVVAFLASEDAAYVTGQVIHVDGGLAM